MTALIFFLYFAIAFIYQFLLWEVIRVDLRRWKIVLRRGVIGALGMAVISAIAAGVDPEYAEQWFQLSGLALVLLVVGGPVALRSNFWKFGLFSTRQRVLIYLVVLAATFLPNAGGSGLERVSSVHRGIASQALEEATTRLDDQDTFVHKLEVRGVKKRPDGCIQTDLAGYSIFHIPRTSPTVLTCNGKVVTVTR